MSRGALRHRRASAAGGTPPPPDPDNTYDDLILNAQPVLYLTLDGTAAGLLDQSGRAHHGTTVGSWAAATGPGDGRGSVRFNGNTGNYISVADHADLSVPTTGVLTIEGWFSQSVLEFPEKEGSGYVQPMGKLAYGSACEWEVRLYSETNTETPPRPYRWSVYAFNASCGLGTGSYFQDAGVVDQWVHVVGVINMNATSAQYPTGYVKIYRDGILRDQDALQNYNIVPTDTTTPVRIGAASLDSFFDGKAARAAVYNYELTATEIRSHYRHLVPAVPGSITNPRHVGTATAAASGTTLSITVGASGVPAGSTLLAKVAAAYTASGPTMTDTRGNTWTRDRTTPSDGNVTRAAIFRAPITSPLVAGDIIQVTWSVATTHRVASVDEFEDVALTLALEDQNSDSDTGTGPTLGSAPTVDNVTADAMVYGLMAVSGPSGDTYTEDTGGDYTSLTTVSTSGAGDLTLRSAWKSVNATGAYTYVPALGTSRLWLQLIVTYRAGPGQPTPSTYDAALLAAGPVMYLTMDGTADGYVDQTGRGHNATANGSPTAAAGGIGDGKGSLDFDDSGTQYLEVADHNELGVTNTGVLAIEAWISPSTIEFSNEQPGNPATDYVYWAGKAGTNENEWQSRMYSFSTPNLSPQRPNRISVYVNNLGGGFGAGSYFQVPVVANEWIMYVGIIDSRPHATYGAQGYTRIYRNGVLMNTNAILPWNITPGNGTAPVRIGTSSLGAFWEGRIAKFALWSREPSPAEIQARYAMAAPPAPPPPTGTADFQGHVGSATATTSGTTSVITLTTGIPVGHTLFVDMVADYTAGQPTVADSSGNTYTRDRSAPDGGNTIRAATFSVRVTTALAAGDTITVTWPASVTRRAVSVNAWTKLAYPIVVDVQNGGTGAGTNPSIAVTNVYGDVLLRGFIGVAGPVGDAFEEDVARQWASLTRVGTTGAGVAADDRTIVAAYRAVPTTGTYTYGPTLGTSRTWVRMLVAYRAATYSPPPVPVGTAALVKHLDAAHSAASGTSLVLTLPAAASTRPDSRADVPAGLKIPGGSLIAPTLPITGMTGSGTGREIVAAGVYEGYDFPGRVIIQASGVTLRNCRWLGSADYWCVETYDNTGTVIQDCEMASPVDRAITGSGFTASRILFHDMGGDPFQLGGGVGAPIPTIIEDCLGYDFQPNLAAHVDGAHLFETGTMDVTIRRNWFELEYDPAYIHPGDPETGFTSPVFFQPNPDTGGTPQGLLLVHDNVLIGSASYYGIRFEEGVTSRCAAIRNKIDTNTAVPPIEGGVTFEGVDNVRADGTVYNDPAQITPGADVLALAGSGSGAAVPVGNTVVVQVVADYTTAGPTVTDSRGNVYTRDRTGADTGNTIRVSILSAPITTALQGGDTITITPGGATPVTRRAAIADEYSGVLTPTVVDRVNSRAGTSTSPSVTVTTTSADALLVAAVGLAGPSTDVFDDDALWTGLTARGTSGASPATLDRTIHAAWRSVAAAGPYTYAPELGTSRLWVAAFVAYKAALAPAPPDPPAPPVEEPVTYPAVSGLVPAGTLPTNGLSSTALTEDTSTTLATPERGFFTYTETHWLADDSGHVPLVAADLATARTSLGRTLAFRYLGLEKYRSQDLIDASYITALATDLAAARTAGVKLIIRCTYGFTYVDPPGPYNSDTTKARVLGHIEQLLPTLNRYADVIFSMQAGFVGTWGEWYYSDNFTDDPAIPGTLTAQDWADRLEIVEALVNGLDDRVFVLLRYPGIKDHWYPHPSSHVDTRRLGWHNDAFLAPSDDYGTYNTFTDVDVATTRAYTSFEVFARPVPNGGESAATNGVDSEWTAALAELVARGFTYLNPLYHPDVLASWGSDIDIAKRRLGYRLVATVARSQDAAARGGNLNVQVDIGNAGFAYPTSPRPVVIVLDDQAGNRAEYLTSIDVRTFTPGATQTLWANLVIPSTGLPAGSYRICVWFPDQDPGLQTRPEYSLRLANTGTWDATRGYNNLRAVTVT